MEKAAWVPVRRLSGFRGVTRARWLGGRCDDFDRGNQRPPPSSIRKRGDRAAQCHFDWRSHLSRKPLSSGCRRCFERGRQHEQAHHRKRLVDPAWSKNLACAEAPYTGTGRPHVWPVAAYGTGPHWVGEEP